MGERWALRVEQVNDAHYGPMRSCVLYDHDAQVCYVGHSEDGEAALRELVNDANRAARLEQGIREIAKARIDYVRDGHGFAHYLIDDRGRWIGAAGPLLQRVAVALLDADGDPVAARYGESAR